MINLVRAINCITFLSLFFFCRQRGVFSIHYRLHAVLCCLWIRCNSERWCHQLSFNQMRWIDPIDGYSTYNLNRISFWHTIVYTNNYLCWNHVSLSEPAVPRKRFFKSVFVKDITASFSRRKKKCRHYQINSLFRRFHVVVSYCFKQRTHQLMIGRIHIRSGKFPWERRSCHKNTKIHLSYDF